MLSDTTFGLTHPHHHENNEILWSQHQFATQRFKREFSDPLYSEQWHHHPIGGMINVRADKVWNELGITGNGVRIALVDDGIVRYISN